MTYILLEDKISVKGKVLAKKGEKITVLDTEGDVWKVQIGKELYYVNKSKLQAL